jgi:hypothetical protein
MKVKDMIAALSKADPEGMVCQFTESGPEEVEDLGVFKGPYNFSMAPKMVWSRTSGEYVGIGNPGNYEASAPVEDCEPIRNLLENE